MPREGYARRVAQQITSRSNPLFQRFRDAVEHHDREIVLEGPKQISDALAQGWVPIAMAADRSDRAEGAIVFSHALFAQLSDTVTSQGLLALFARPESGTDAIFRASGRRIIVVLDGVQDPGNVGTIVRLAAAFDAAGVLLMEGCADPWSRKALRASAGTALLVPLGTASSRELVHASEEHGFRLFAAVRSDETRLRSLPPEGGALILGSEGRGVSEELLRLAEPVSIAISPRVESINVAAAAAILLSGWYSGRPAGHGTLPARAPDE